MRPNRLCPTSPGGAAPGCAAAGSTNWPATTSLDPAALLPQGEQLEAADSARGMRRIVVRGADGALSAALYLTHSGELPPRDWVAGLLGKDEAHGLELLAGRPAKPAPDRGPVICVCHGVGALEITEAACAGAATIEAIGARTRAGTNCGSCRPAIARLLDAALTEAMEAAQ